MPELFEHLEPNPIITELLFSTIFDYRATRAMTETDCPSEREFPSWQDRDAKSGKFSAASLR